jgi:hypothetical protein
MVTALPLVCLEAVAPAVLGALTVLPPTVTCSPTAGLRAGGGALVTCLPLLLTGGTATHGMLTVRWPSHRGASTVWTRPAPLAVTDASTMTDITSTGGSPTRSFASYPTPSTTRPDTTWTVTSLTGPCSSGDLSGLTVAASSVAW